MKKLFISCPMAGISDEDIQRERVHIQQETEEITGEKFEVIDSFVDGRTFSEKNAPVQYLGQSLMLLAEADVVAFGKGWQRARGCRIEHQVCIEYDIDAIDVVVDRPPPAPLPETNSD